MATGLLALLDDVAAIAKIAAASLDDTAAAAVKAGAKAAGVVIDDTAVTPRYVTGFAASRELPMIGKITLGSLRNKLVYLLPASLGLSALAPWAIPPLLVAGAAYLCFEGAEKLAEMLGRHGQHEDVTLEVDAVAQERAMVASAIRTDLILSAEIMAITLNSVADKGLLEQAVVLAVVGVGITLAVYGVVALIVKADDAGMILAPSRFAILRITGRGLVTLMPVVLRILGAVGTAAMLWVGGGIIVHGLETLHVAGPARFIHHIEIEAGQLGGPVLHWAAGAACAGILGTAIGAMMIVVRALILAAVRQFTDK